ncbi:MAG: glycoside hydrolase family 88 protein [Spirochaetales bacterium]|nr:glycoside hydrolase family 88 protein [Spirochaetales bacterium]
MDYVKRVLELADSAAAQGKPGCRWMWGEALLGYAFTELDAWLGEDRYLKHIEQYGDHFTEHSPRVDQADTSAPALITYALQKKLGKPGYKVLTDRVLDYIKNEPRLMDDAVNHLGNSLEGKFYPKSIWVDSLMMFSVFPARYAAENGDPELLDFAARQPGLYAGTMQDPEDKLWYHSYWVKQKTHYPRKKLFWGRGNGWVIAALPMILDQLPEDHPERPGILKILEETSAALLPCQREDGFWETVLNKQGKTYREASATALMACGWLHSANKDYLPQVYGEAGVKAFESVSSLITQRKKGLALPEISGPTIPLPLLPYPGYKLIPRGDNWDYGLAALFLALIQYDRYLKTQEKEI